MSELSAERIQATEAEIRRLEAQIGTCESKLHAAPIGCPYCQRDARQRDILRDVLTAYLALRERDQRLIAQWREEAAHQREWAANHRANRLNQPSKWLACEHQKLSAAFDECADQLTAEGRSRAEARTP